MMFPVTPTRRPLSLVLGIGLVAALVFGLVACTGDSKLKTPDPDAQKFPGAAEPGDLVSIETWQGTQVDGLDIWRIVYLTEDRHDQTREASALVSARTDRGDAALPTLAFAHGTTGVAESCAPSARPQPITTDGGALNVIAQEGMVLVAPDYAGLGTSGPHGFLVGEEAAYDVLNALRAVRQVPTVNVNRRAVVWGQSQGGHAALWAGMRASDYAPDVKLLGVAATAPPTDMISILEQTDDSGVLRRFHSYVLASWRKTYPESGLWEEVAPANREPVVKIGELCGNEDLDGLPSQLEAPVLPSLAKGSAFRRLVDQNVPNGDIDVPVLIAQGSDDAIVPAAAQRDWVATRCAAGQELNYIEYPGADHLSVAMAMVPDLISWTVGRLEGHRAPSTC